jgi:hypothetical protein
MENLLMSETDIIRIVENKEKSNENQSPQDNPLDVMKLLPPMPGGSSSNNDRAMEKYDIAQRRTPQNLPENPYGGLYGNGSGIPQNRQPELPATSVHRLPETVIPQSQRTPVYTERAQQPRYGTPAEPPNGRYRRTPQN